LLTADLFLHGHLDLPGHLRVKDGSA
jgi:hypothetical protein